MAFTRDRKAVTRVVHPDPSSSAPKDLRKGKKEVESWWAPAGTKRISSQQSQFNAILATRHGGPEDWIKEISCQSSLTQGPEKNKG